MPATSATTKSTKTARPKLYLIHGWTYTVAPWERTLAALEKQGFDVEVLHVPGLTSPSKKVWTIAEYVEWADRHIPDGGVALGHSNGGRILLNLCVAKPDKLRHLILLDSAGVYEVSSKRDVARTLSKRLGFLKRIPGLTKIWHKLTGASDYARAPENMKKTLANMLDSDRSLNLAKVTTPTSILWGAADTVTPPHQAEIIHAKIAGSTLDVFPGWTHAPYISHPTELARAIWHVYRHPPEPIAPVESTAKDGSVAAHAPASATASGENSAAAVQPTPVRPAAAKSTATAQVSASMALKKAQNPSVPSTAGKSASLALKKAAGPVAEDATRRSAVFAVSGGAGNSAGSASNASGSNKVADPQPTLLAELASVDYEVAAPEIPRQIISTASVPKVSRLTRIQRRLRPAKAHKPAKSAIKPAKSTISSAKSTASSAQTSAKSAKTSSRKAKA